MALKDFWPSDATVDTPLVRIRKPAVYGMNKVAYNIGAVSVQSALENIHYCILAALKE